VGSVLPAKPRLKEAEMVTRDEVIHAYRLLLGRDPEDDAAVNRHMRISDWRELRRSFLASKEFQRTGGGLGRRGQTNPAEYLHAKPSRVDIDISPEHFAKLVDHVQRTWERLGAERPHFSVLTSRDFLPDKIEGNLDKFYKSGARAWQRFESAMARAGKGTSTEATAFELGCGVGRVTAELAPRFRQVIGCDISASHLALARNHLGELGFDNVKLLHLDGLDRLTTLEPIDVFYSVLVLQHNPPPLMHRMLQIIFKKLREGGFAYFQVPVAARNYEFDIEKYLSRIDAAKNGMEMHVMPQKELFRLLRGSRLHILDYQIDRASGAAFQSVSILAEKTV
jgi:SAM-dependent methyltransferase